MVESLAILLTTSYIAWFFQHHETQALYPFDRAYAAPPDPRIAETRLTTQDGESLVVWTAPPDPGHPVVFYLLGNAGSLSDRTDRFEDLLDEGFGLIAHGYRGSSGSTGNPDEASLTRDARLVATKAEAFDAALVLYGESLGAAVAIKLAQEGIGSRLALEAPFTTLPDLVDTQFPTENLGTTISEHWDNATRIRTVNQPLMILHGARDRLVPQDMGRTLYANAASADKRFIDVLGAGHGALWRDGTRQTILDFIENAGP